MRTTTPDFSPRGQRDTIPTWWILAGAVFLAALTPSVVPAEEGSEAGRVLQVPYPITTEVTSRLREVAHEAITRFNNEENERPGKERRVFKLILDFNPENHQPNSSDSYGACYDLAKYLRKLQPEVRVIAYVHGKVGHHTVLPVLACSEIVMARGGKPLEGNKLSPGGKLGPVVTEESLDDAEKVAYDKMAANHLPLALVRKMYDKNVVVVKVNPGDRFREGTEKDGEVVLPAGLTEGYTFDQARLFGLCQQEPREDIEEVVAKYRLPRSSLSPAPLLGRDPVAWVIEATGEVDARLRERLPRRFTKALEQKANLIILNLRCHGGDSQSGYDLANYLLDLNKDRGDHPVKTVAYYTREASGNAVFLALACDTLVMEKDAVLKAGPMPDKQTEKIARDHLVDVAHRRHYSELLAEGLLNPDLKIRWVASARGGGEERPLTQEDLDADARNKESNWFVVRDGKLDPVKNEGEYLAADAVRAQKMGLAWAVVNDLDGVYNLEGVKKSQVREAGDDMLDDLAKFLCNDWTSFFLVMFGFICLILELKMPGASLPGVLAAVCFVLFFWSHSQLNGQITMLAVLLFFLGLLLIGMEIFVMPGLGVCGISGILLMLCSLGLVAYGHWPRTNEEWVGFGRAMSPFSLSILGAVAAGFTLARYLPHIPFANRLILKPQSEEELPDEPLAAQHAELAALLGAIGVAATPLRPAGKAQFGDEFIDVVAEGSFVQPGSRVQVVEIEGHRVVVKEV